MITREEALLLLRKWCEEGTLLRVVTARTVADFSFDLRCRIKEVCPDGWLRLSLSVKDDLFAIWLGTLLFEWRDLRGDEPLSELIAAGLVHGAVLAAVKSKTEMIFFVEIERLAD